MKIYIVRHGKTDWNVLGKLQGKTDIPLNEVGKKQAELVKQKIEDKIDLCFTSPLSRARETAEIISDTKTFEDQRLIERCMGIYEGKTTFNDRKKYWLYDENYSDNGVEPIQDLFKRVSEFLEEIKSKYSDKTILIVTHGATMRALHFCITTFKNDTDFLSLDVPNCAVFKYDI